MFEWEPIETAPIMPFNVDQWYMAHSPGLLLWNGNYCVIGSYHFTKTGKGRWLRDANGRVIRATHWRPLPTGPEKEKPA